MAKPMGQRFLDGPTATDGIVRTGAQPTCDGATRMSEPESEEVPRQRADAADHLAVYLNELGYEATAAYDGHQALTFARFFSPDVAVMDVELGGVDGYELAERLRRLHADIAIIALSSHPPSTTGGKDEACFDAHFVKLLQLDELLAVIRDLTSSQVRA
jgi:DNA-binding response OmpR family regulator